MCFAVFIGLRLSAQQNFFNVPSSELTEDGHLFFQEQLNLTKGSGESNTTLTYGILKRWEAGINFNNVKLYPKTYSEYSKTGYPGMLLNTQYLFYSTTSFMYTSGLVSGLVTQDGTATAYFYNNIKYSSPKNNCKLVAGVYYAHIRNTEPRNQIGIQAGLDLTLVPDKFNLTADCISGKTSLSLLVVGFTYHVTQHIMLSGGMQAPMPHAPNNPGAVFELTIL